MESTALLLENLYRITPRHVRLYYLDDQSAGRAAGNLTTMNKLQIHHRQAFATAHQGPPPSASRHDVAQRQAQKLVCPLAKSRGGQRTQCRACITRSMTIARRTRIHQSGLGSDRKCRQINEASGSHGNEEGEGARARSSACTLAAGFGMPLNVTTKCFSHSSSCYQATRT